MATHTFDPNNLEPSQHPSRSSHVPIELVGHIIAIVNDGRREIWEYRPEVLPALCACSLVCREWNDVCRPHLFRTLSIDLYNDDTETLVTSHQILRLSFMHFTAPHLFQHIVEFSFVVVRRTPEELSWLPLALPRLVNLRTLYICSEASGNRPTLLKPLAEGIAGLIAAAPLKSLCLASWEVVEDGSDLLPLLSACSSTLEELLLKECSVSDRGTMPMPKGPAPPSVCLGALRKLELGPEFLPMKRLKDIKVPNLHSLTCAYKTDPFRELSPWISVSLPELILEVERDSDIPQFGQSIRPSCLTITITQKKFEPSYFPMMTWIKNCLLRVPFSHELHRLNVNIIGVLRSYPVDPHHPTRGDYEELYPGLQSVHKHGSLEHISLTHKLASDSGYPDDTSPQVVILNEVFGSLVEARPVVFDINLTHYCDVTDRFKEFLHHRL